ncbi:hypothetical protein JZ751_006309 [Albula glossodonta]|uniref:Epithelial membrane protein 2 n=1 Tax=Albula glossodonta TaxID=121402 RepID=A0A8T2NB46_9TELE|nr:hypothetical protein JZ751_006309 [Albula glossodonta]
MLVILAFIILFHIISATLLFISTINNAWWVSGQFSTDLWFTCNNTCFPVLNSENSAGYLQAVQATMILATILCCVGFFVFILQLFPLCVMIGASIYTAQHKSFQQPSLHPGNYGYSFVLAWISFPLTLISGLMYLVLRKRR